MYGARTISILSAVPARLRREVWVEVMRNDPIVLAKKEFHMQREITIDGTYH